MFAEGVGGFGHVPRNAGTAALAGAAGRACRMSGAVEKTRTSTGLSPTTTSTLRVYQFRHDRKIDRAAMRPSGVGAGP